MRHFYVEKSICVQKVLDFMEVIESIHTKKATRGSAGVCAFVKKELLNTFDIKIIDENIERILWLEFAAKFSKCHFYVVVCYLPPADTCRPVDSEIFFQSLLNQIYSYQHKGNIYICGDMNARVRINTDYIEGVDLVKPRNIRYYIENHHGDVFANFVSDVNLGMFKRSFSG